MSYEGYVIVLCRVGHQRHFDAYQERPSTCICGAEFVWEKHVDQTNCDDQPVALEIDTRAVIDTCNLGHRHVVIEETYKIPSTPDPHTETPAKDLG